MGEGTVFATYLFFIEDDHELSLNTVTFRWLLSSIHCENILVFMSST